MTKHARIPQRVTYAPCRHTIELPTGTLCPTVCPRCGGREQRPAPVSEIGARLGSPVPSAAVAPSDDAGVRDWPPDAAFLTA